MISKKIKFIMMGTVLMLQLACSGKAPEQTLEVSTLDYTSNSGEAKYELKIPQIVDEKSEDIAYFNIAMQEESRYILENLSSEKNDGKIQEAYMSYDVHKNDFGVLSITLMTNAYTGGAHYVNKLESFNINLKDNSILLFDKLIKEDGIEYFNMRINDMIKNKEKVVNLQGKEVMFFENCDANVINSVIYFEGDKMVFVFPEYDLAPYSSGMPVFKFNKKDVKKYLNI